MATKKYYYAVGRRKTATATAHLTKGKGNILVKKGDEYININDYFIGE
jgi:ribosomal protein S9